jgi:hypothetical protein
MVAARVATLRQGARTDLAQICARSQDDEAGPRRKRGQWAFAALVAVLLVAWLAWS